MGDVGPKALTRVGVPDRDDTGVVTDDEALAVGSPLDVLPGHIRRIRRVETEHRLSRLVDDGQAGDA